MCYYEYYTYRNCNHHMMRGRRLCNLRGIPNGERGYINGVCTAVHRVVWEKVGMAQGFCPRCVENGHTQDDEGYVGS
jgi:hypothetical protein